jgi:transcriptional regulator with XRE-family HTH domain
MTIRNQKPIQIKLAVLQARGWTLAALADRLEQTVNTLEKWKAGDRNPANEKAVLAMLDNIEKLKRIPKRRRYIKGSRKSISTEGI